MKKEQGKEKEKGRGLLTLKILTLVFLIPTLVGFFATLDTFVTYLQNLQNGDGNTIGVALVLVFCVFLWYLPCNVLDIVFGICGLRVTLKAYKNEEERKGKTLNLVWFIVCLAVAAVTFAFAVYYIIRFV